MEDFKKIFYDKKEGLTNINKLYEKIQEVNPNISKNELQKFYDKQAINKIMKPIRKPKHFSSYMANYPSHIYQLDIINYTRFKQNNYKYIVCMIDIYSRYLMAKPMTNREMPTIIKNVKDMIEENGPPYKLECDNEFNKKEFINAMDEYNIKIRFSDPDEDWKNPIVERVNGTLQTLLQRIRLLTKDNFWFKYLEDAVYNYNNSTHSTTRHKPIEIWKGEKPNEQSVEDIKHKYIPGDKVKIITKKELFDKIDTVKASKETYVVEQVKGNKIKLFGQDKLYKPHEISIVYELDDDDIDYDIGKPSQEAKEHKKELSNKRIGIDESNIIEGKRERKPKVFYD
jgi:hypothetical protein